MPLVADAVDAVSGAAEPAVLCGADRLFGEYIHLISGKRVALVSNHSGRLADGTHLADALYAHPDVQLEVLFGMEFDIRSNDYAIPRDPQKTIDTPTGVTKYSLYGDIHKPTAAMLGEAEVIVFDIQEVGLRFYEHVNILGFVMEAAAEQGLEVIVLDRPNPLNGIDMDGFVTDDKYRYTFGAYGKIPIRHGMTMGELAKLYIGERLLRVEDAPKLHVVPMKGWRRSMWFDDTGLPWRKPSPNLLTLDAVMAYEGTCLFEGFNVSEGRGTARPFEYIGAPWLDNFQVVRLMDSLGFDGVDFESVTFEPTQMPFLSRPPEFNETHCNGVYLRIRDRNVSAGYRIGIALVWAINRLHPDKLVWNEQVLYRLTGTDRLISMIKAGKTPADIYQSWEAEVTHFKQMRTPYLMY
ncbi:DUF1343 domain-containing protein [Parapedobacter sp. ISTM3]|nr:MULTISPECIES: DUF1343 domain-containing protein [Parapedobacter]MBK1438541.1 DUF1343 domain-containing protein [Parapedobacter sp. ISTM3]